MKEVFPVFKDGTENQFLSSSNMPNFTKLHLGSKHSFSLFQRNKSLQIPTVLMPMTRAAQKDSNITIKSVTVTKGKLLI